MHTVKVLILGATGGTGRHATLEAVTRGYEVTALVRNRAKVPADFERVKIIDGDARDPNAVAAAMQGQEAVVCVLGLGTGKAGLTPNALIATTAPILVNAMTAANVRRLVFTSAFGIADTAHDAPLLARIVFAFVLQNVYADKAMGDTAVRQSALDWTIVYPTLLTSRRRDASAWANTSR